MIIKYNPAPDRMFIEGSADGSRVYLYPTNSAEVLVFDGTTHQELPSIQLPKPLLLNETWAEMMVDKQEARNAHRSRKFEYFANFLERFPGVRYMNLIDGILYVVLWSEAPDMKRPVLAFDAHGTAVTPRFSAQAVLQIAGTWDGTAWLVTWDKEEGAAGLVRVPLADVEQTVSSKAQEWNWF